MLSTVLQAGRKFTMVCDVHPGKDLDVLDDFEVELRTLSDLLADCGEIQGSVMHSEKEDELDVTMTLADLLDEDIKGDPVVMLSDLVNSGTQSSYVCGVGQEDSDTVTQCSLVVDVDQSTIVNIEQNLPMTLQDLLSAPIVSGVPIEETELENSLDQSERHLHDFLSNSTDYVTSDVSSNGVQEIATTTSNLEVGLAKKERGERERKSSKLKNMRFYTYEQPSICKILTRKIFSAVLSLLGTN